MASMWWTALRIEPERIFRHGRVSGIREVATRRARSAHASHVRPDKNNEDRNAPRSPSIGPLSPLFMMTDGSHPPTYAASGVQSSAKVSI